MRDIQVGLHRGVGDLGEEPHHAGHVAQQRKLKRLELHGDLEAELAGVRTQETSLLDGQSPLFGGGDHLLLPEVFAQHQQEVTRPKLVGHVEILADPVHVEPLDAGIEVDEAQGHAGHADDGQPGAAALLADQPPFLDIDIERIGEDVDGVEAQLPGLGDAERGSPPRLDPGRVDQSEFHG